MKHKRKQRWKACAFGLLAGAAMIHPAAAQSSNALIDALIKKGVLTEQEAKDISAELTKSQQSTVFARPSSSNIRDLQIRGRIQAQAGYSNVENNTGSDDYSTLELRRVHLGMRGTLFDNFRAELEAVLVPDSIVMRSAYIEWRQYPQAYIRAGLEKPIFGHEEHTSSASILTIERSNINNQMFSGGAQMNGLSLSGTAGIFQYGGGIYTGRANANPSGMDRYLFNASAGLVLDKFMPEKQKLSIRFDGIHNDDPGARFNFENGFAASIHYAAGPFDLRTEFLQGSPFTGGHVRGAYIMPSYFFTEKLQGVVRYERSTAQNAVINAPARYAQRTSLTPTPASRQGTDFQALYAGLNYYVRGDHLKLMGGVEVSELKNTPAGKLTALTLYGAVRMLF